MATSNWPKSVPVLNRRRICKNKACDYTNGSKDITQWSTITFMNRSPNFISALQLYLMKEFDWTGSITSWNDQATKADIANAFNTVAAAMGYTKGNPRNLQGYNLRRQLRAMKKTKLLPRRVAQNV